MKKIIKLTESDLTKIVKKVLDEQSIPGLSSYNPTPQFKPDVVDKNILPCVPTAFKLAIQSLIKKNYNKLFLKAALGIIGRESDFGESKRFQFTSALKELFAIFGGQTSIGYAQIKPGTVEKFGITESDLMMATGSVDAAYRILLNNYKVALNVGYTTQPSANLKDGTGNSALDISIAAYNLGEKKIVKYCNTNNPSIKRPCPASGKPEIDKNDSSITITNQYVQNYIPNFKTTRWDNVNISSHGYVIEVAKRIKSYTCF